MACGEIVTAELPEGAVEARRQSDKPGLKTVNGIVDLGFAWMVWIIDPGKNALAIMQIKQDRGSPRGCVGRLADCVRDATVTVR